MPRRVVITSIGVVSVLGSDARQILNGLKNDAGVFERPAFDPDATVCAVRDFNVKDFTGRFKNSRYLNRGAQFAAASAMAAVRDSGLDQCGLDKAGLFTGTGPNLDIGGECPEIHGGVMDSGALAALWILRFLPNTAAAVIAERVGIHGENATINTACSASLQAIGEAFRKVKHGYLDLALAGGGDSRLSPGGILAYKKAQTLFRAGGDPQCGYTPFGCNPTGFIPGEGGAFFVLESLSSAQKRGVVIHGELCGFGSSMDGSGMTAPDPTGKWAEIAVRQALNEAGMSPAQVDLVSAHGTGTLLNDRMEADLIQRIFGDHTPPVVALKSRIGHLASACGAVELAICLACLKAGYLPPIRNLDRSCRPEVNFVKREMFHAFGTILLENFGFGGQNAALVIKKWRP